jgi:hypothetical protein
MVVKERFTYKKVLSDRTAMVYMRAEGLPPAGNCGTAERPAGPLKAPDAHAFSPLSISPLPLDKRCLAGSIIDKSAGMAADRGLILRQPRPHATRALG